MMGGTNRVRRILVVSGLIITTVTAASGCESNNTGSAHLLKMVSHSARGSRHIAPGPNPLEHAPLAADGSRY